MNNFLFKLILLFNPLYKKFGVDTRQLKTILATKLLIDNRTPAILMGIHQRQGNTSKTRRIMFYFMGFMLLSILVFVDQPLLEHAVFFTVFMVILVAILISDFTHVLIDVKDNMIILSRPVTDATFTLSRILHICLHLAQLAIPLTLPTWIAVLIKDNLNAGLLFPLQVLLATLMSLFFVNIIYLLILKITGASGFKKVIVYFQMALTIALFAGYMIFPRLIESSFPGHIYLLELPVSYVFPSVWVAALHVLAMDTFSNTLVILSMIATIIPVVCMILIVKFLAPGFNKKLALIDVGTAKQKSSTGVPRKSLSARLAQIFTNTSAGNAGFRITWQLSSRIREFKINCYPAFAYIPLYFVWVIFLNDNDKSMATTWQELPSTETYLFILYLLSFIPIAILQQITKTDKYKAAWIYYSSPLSKPGPVLMGMLKAVWVKYVLPFGILLIFFVLFIWGWSALDDVVLASINILSITAALAYFRVKKFPFSISNRIDGQKGKIFFNILPLLIALLLGYLHSFINEWSAAVGLFMIISLAVCYLMLKRYNRLNWADLE